MGCLGRVLVRLASEVADGTGGTVVEGETWQQFIVGGLSMGVVLSTEWDEQIVFGLQAVFSKVSLVHINNK